MKYLVKVNYVYVTEMVEDVETQVKTSEIESYDVKYQTDSKSLPRGGDFIFIEATEVLTSPVVSTDEEGKLILVEDPATALKVQLTSLYDVMVEDVYDAMYSTFGTRNDVSAAATASTWEAMLRRPTNYFDTELGLSTEEDVITFAALRINLADEYGVYRLKRIKKFTDDREGLLNV